jgi:16S rRNA (guanine966-N2)-methyltransferase
MTLRIGAGDQKGRLLRAPARAVTRPTSGRVRGALFNILGNRVLNAVWLDLYAGSGIIGLEALCRGAAWTTFVEAHPDARRCITRNIQTLGVADRTQIWPGTVERFLRDRTASTTTPRSAPPLFDVVFADPPYHTEGGAIPLRQLLPLCRDSGKIAPHAWLIVEHAATTAIPPGGGEWSRTRTYTYGESALTVYQPTLP